MAPDKLYLYDRASDIDRKQAEDRFKPGEVVKMGAASADQLHAGLARLVSDGFEFKRMLIQTHGGPGRVRFGDDRIHAHELLTDFAHAGYFKLFPGRSKIYFDGCNVAEGDLGWEFLQAAGQVLLRNGGGITMGWETTGYAGIPFTSQHTVHFGGLRLIEFKGGGIETWRYAAEDASMPDVLEATRKLNSF